MRETIGYIEDASLVDKKKCLSDEAQKSVS